MTRLLGTDKSAQQPNLNGNAVLPFVIPTRISCHAALDEAVYAPFPKERRMRSAKATFHLTPNKVV